MSDSPTNESLRGPSVTGRKMGFLVFFLGFFLGFVVALALNGKMAPKETEENSLTQKSESKETIAEHSETAQSESQTAVGDENHDSAGSELSTKEMVISRQTRDRLLTFDFLNLLQDAELHRYRFEGETKGLRLTKIRTGSLYEKAGFKDGDIIEQINGLAFADVEKRPSKAREQLPIADRLTFKVRRDDKVVTIKVKVAGDAAP